MAERPSDSGPGLHDLTPFHLPFVHSTQPRALCSLHPGGSPHRHLLVHSLPPLGPCLDVIRTPPGEAPWTALPLPCSPHRIKVVIRGHVVLVITGQAQLVSIALVNEVPELLGAQGLWRKHRDPHPSCLGTPLRTRHGAELASFESRRSQALLSLEN